MLSLFMKCNIKVSENICILSIVYWWFEEMYSGKKKKGSTVHWNVGRISVTPVPQGIQPSKSFRKELLKYN